MKIATVGKLGINMNPGNIQSIIQHLKSSKYSEVLDSTIEGLKSQLHEIPARVLSISVEEAKIELADLNEEMNRHIPLDNFAKYRELFGGAVVDADLAAKYGKELIEIVDNLLGSIETLGKTRGRIIELTAGVASDSRRLALIEENARIGEEIAQLQFERLMHSVSANVESLKIMRGRKIRFIEMMRSKYDLVIADISKYKKVGRLLQHRQYLEYVAEKEKQDVIEAEIKTLESEHEAALLAITEAKNVGNRIEISAAELRKLETSQSNYLRHLAESIEAFEDKLANRENLTKIAAEYKRACSRRMEITGELAEARAELRNCERLAAELREKKARTEENEGRRLGLTAELNAIAARLDLLSKLKAIVGQRNLPIKIAAKKFAAFEKYINDQLSLFVDFTIKIEAKLDGVQAKIVFSAVRAGREIGISALSGYQTFVLDAITKAAMTKVGAGSKSSLFFIDEGLDCIDSENMKSMGMLLELLLASHSQIFLISHLPEIAGLVNKRLSIEYNPANGYSRLIGYL